MTKRTASAASSLAVAMLGLFGLALGACTADASSSDAETGSDEINRSQLVGTWRFQKVKAGAASLSGLELRADGTYVAEVMRPCSAGEPAEAAGCQGAPIRGTWSFAPFIHEITPWGTLTLHEAATRYEQPGNVEKKLDLVLRLADKPLARSPTLAIDEAGDHARLAFAFGPAEIHATLEKDPSSSGFCASSADCANADLVHVELACKGSYRKTCTASRTCAYPCMPASTAGYGDACGLLPGSSTRTTCLEVEGQRIGLRCDDSMAGGYGICRATAPR